MTFDEWWDTSRPAMTPDTFMGWEASCRQAWYAARKHEPEIERLRAALRDLIDWMPRVVPAAGQEAEWEDSLERACLAHGPLGPND